MLSYKPLMRCYQQYSVQLWSSIFKKDKFKPEKVPRKAAMMIIEMDSLLYKRRLIDLALFDLAK